MWHNAKFILIVIQSFTLKRSLVLQTNLQSILSLFLLIKVLNMLNILFNPNIASNSVQITKISNVRILYFILDITF